MFKQYTDHVPSKEGEGGGLINYAVPLQMNWDQLSYTLT